MQRALCPLTPPRSDVAYFSGPFSVDIHMDVFPFILSLSLSNSWFSFSAKIGLCSTFLHTLFVNSYFIWPVPYFWTFRLFPNFCCYQPHNTVMKTSILQPHVTHTNLPAILLSEKMPDTDLYGVIPFTKYSKTNKQN